MSGGLLLLGVLLAFVIIALAVRANRRLLVIRAENGRIVSARGRAPGELLHDFGDIFKRAGTTCSAALVLRAGRVELDVRGPGGEAVAQQLRNVTGRFPLARLRSAARIDQRRQRSKRE